MKKKHITYCVIYTRFSPRPKEAADESESCEIQEQLCREYAAKKGYVVAAVFNDPDVSGQDDDRADYFAAIAALKRGYVLLAFKNDRLYRSVYMDSWTEKKLAKIGASIETVVGGPQMNDPDSIMTRKIIAAVDERHARINANCTSWHMRQHNVNLRAMGSIPPYGMKRGKPLRKTLDDGRVVEQARWTPCPKEQAILAEMIRLHVQEGYGFRKVARKLNEKGYRIRSGDEWKPGNVQSILYRYKANLRDGIKGRQQDDLADV